MAGPRSKHHPVAGRNNQFAWSENMAYHDIPKGKAFETNKPNPERLVIKLKDTRGQRHEYHRVDSQNPKWDDAAWIHQSNRWFDQVLVRRLDKSPDPLNRKRAARNLWSVAEKTYLEKLIKGRSAGGQALKKVDWDWILQELNQQFAGKTLKKGVALTTGFGSSNSAAAKMDRILKERTMTSIKRQAKKWGFDVKG